MLVCDLGILYTASYALTCSEFCK